MIRLIILCKNYWRDLKNKHNYQLDLSVQANDFDAIEDWKIGIRLN